MDQGREATVSLHHPAALPCHQRQATRTTGHLAARELKADCYFHKNQGNLTVSVTPRRGVPLRFSSDRNGLSACILTRANDNLLALASRRAMWKHRAIAGVFKQSEERFAIRIRSDGDQIPVFCLTNKHFLKRRNHDLCTLWIAWWASDRPCSSRRRAISYLGKFRFGDGERGPQCAP